MLTNKLLANRLLTYAFVVFLLCIGCDKIFQTNIITDWQSLVGPVVSFLLHVGPGTVVMIEGLIEIGLAIALLTQWKTGGLAVLALTIAIVTVDLIILRYFNLAIREVIMIVMCGAIYLIDEETPVLLR